MSNPDDPNSNKRQRDRAFAIQYQDDQKTPVVVAAGVGELAKRIVEIAKKNDIPIQEHSELAQMLSQIGVGQSISQESYKLVAEILSFLYNLDIKFKQATPELKIALDDLKDNDPK